MVLSRIFEVESPPVFRKGSHASDKLTLDEHLNTHWSVTDASYNSTSASSVLSNIGRLTLLSAAIVVNVVDIAAILSEYLNDAAVKAAQRLDDR
jgi:hypothetical protein